MQKTHSQKFDEQHVLHMLRHYLPTQGPLKDFVHHNTLHAFQDRTFYDGIFKASTIFGFQTTLTLTEYRDLYTLGRIAPDVLTRMIVDRKGADNLQKWQDKLLHASYEENTDGRIGALRRAWQQCYPIDLDNAVQPLFFRILGSYLDQGIAITAFPFEAKGLLAAVRELEKHSAVSFFRSERARQLLDDKKLTITKLLELLVGKKQQAYFEQYIYDQQFGHRGWSGMVAHVADNPESLLYQKRVTLEDAIILELLLEIDALTSAFGDDWRPLAEGLAQPPQDIFADEPVTELREILEIWQDAFEWSYYDTVLAGLLLAAPDKKPSKKRRKHTDFQAIFCIDEREYSLRTHLERTDTACQTLGTAGFFGVEFYFRPAYAKFYEKLCPASVSPAYLVQEVETHPHAHKKEIMYTKHSHKLLRGMLLSYALGLPALGKLVANLVNPAMSPAIADAFSHMNPEAELTVVHAGEHDAQKNLQIGFTVTEMADRVERVLRNIGLTRDFAPLVYIVAHGSSSANNPHHGAHDCGACSGRPGAVNARVFAAMANHEAVRQELARRGVVIPAKTQFVGSLHDTASDEMQYYDEKVLTVPNLAAHQTHKQAFETALDLNAKERSRRFNSISTTQPIKKIRRAIKQRSVSYFEPRPELGHGTNALCIVGGRDLTQRLFLDRRAFLHSYDYTADPEGKLLDGILRALSGVCGGINLEYYFSRMDNYKLGAGTKLPHNVMGLIGVANSSDGDLRPGLPLQMVEVHDPVRLLMIVHHRPEVLRQVIAANPALQSWFYGDWVHLVALNPDDNRLYSFKNRRFVPYEPLTKELPIVHDIVGMLESAPGMKTNHILDATQENLPVQILEKVA